MVQSVRKDDRPTAARAPVWAGAGLLCASMLALAPAVLASPGRAAPSTVAAVFPPGWSGADTVKAAAQSSRILRLGGLPNIVIVRTDRPERLRADGAWLFLNPILAGCNPQTES